jgi:hypothetical protein
MRVRMNRVNPVTIEALRLQADGDHHGLRALAAQIRSTRNHDDDDATADDDITITVHERLTDRIRTSAQSPTTTIPDSDTETLVSRVRRQRQERVR